MATRNTHGFRRIAGLILGFTLLLPIAPVSADPGTDNLKIVIEKLTDGFDADNPNDADVPEIAPGAPITWTFVVTNEGDLPLHTIRVNDDQLGGIPYVSGDTDGDGWLDLDETWIFEAMGSAADLSTAAGTVPGCGDGRPTYQNRASTVGRSGNWQSTSDFDYSHYCNPDGEPDIDIEKLTEGFDADDPFGADVPKIAVGLPVTWTYLVTNTGTVDIVTVDVTDDQGVVPVFIGGDDGDGILNPGEVWTYQASGVVEDLGVTTFTTVDGCEPDDPEPAYENMGLVVGTTGDGTVVDDIDPSHYCNTPSIDIEKLTNGNQADGSFDGDVPVIAAGDMVTWTYIVTNTGDVDLFNVTVTDDQGIVPIFSGGDDGDGILQPGEVWTYEATGTAEHLGTTGFTTVDGCDPAGPRPAYENMGAVVANTIRGASVDDIDPSHYCNPPDAPDIDIEKLTNGNQADGSFDADVPLIAPGDMVTWTYIVTNTGNVDIVDVDVTDDQGIVPIFDGGDDGDGILNPGEVWTYEATGTAEDLTATVFTTADGCDPSDPRPAYENMGMVEGTTGDGTVVDDIDPSHYCNPPGTPDIDIEKATNGNDADDPFGVDVPVIAPGDPVTWTYVVTNTGDVDIVDVDVTDDQGVVPVFSGGDDGDGILNPGEMWTYAAGGVAEDLATTVFTTADGCDPSDPRPAYVNLGMVVGTTGTGTMVDDNDPSSYCNPPGNPDIDIEKFTLVVPTSSGADLCDTYGKPSMLTMRYTGDGNDASSHTQDSGKVVVTGDPLDADPVHITASEKINGDGAIWFTGVVALGDTFVIDAGVGERLDTETHIWIQDAGETVTLQNIEFHTSCSQPLLLGDQFGAAQLLGFVDEDGMGESLPLSTGFGEDADTPTGPSATAGDTIQWTYVVTNPGDQQLADVMVTDDNGTAGDSSDDFNPDPLLDGAFNVGDTDMDGLLDPGEEWLYQSFGVAQLGQYANVSDVVGTPVDSNGDPTGAPDVVDDDPSHYIATFPPGDVCDTTGKPQILHLVYTGDGDDATSHSQDSGKVSVTGDPMDADPVHIIVTDKEDPNDDKAKIFFDDVVALGDDFNADSMMADKDEFPSATFVFIYDETETTLLQSIEFHTSCSQPLNLGDQFGAIQFIGLTDKDGNSAGI
ncbi:MAG: hypothetical protein HKN07_04260 [Acidimicrobiia bacterium]|nr:hypothetical protein [Acidimicrobiia bacterium]